MTNKTFYYKRGFKNSSLRGGASYEGFFEPICEAPSSSFSCRRPLWHKLGHPQEVVCGSNKPCGQLSLVSSFEPGLPESAGGLHPAEYLFNSFSDALAYRVAGVPGCAAIDGRASLSFGIGSHMRSNLPASKRLNKTPGVVSLVSTEGLWLDTFAGLMLEHILGGFPLRGPVGSRNLEINKKSVSIFHKGMSPVRESGFLPFGFSHQETLRVGGGTMGLVSPLLPVKINRGVAGIPVSGTVGLVFIPGTETLKAGPCVK